MSRPSIAAFRTTVAAVHRLSPSLVRLTLTGPDLARLHDGDEHGPRDLRVKVVLPSPGHPMPDLSELGEGWYSRWLALPPEVRGVVRTYTVRRSRVTTPRPGGRPRLRAARGRPGARPGVVLGGARPAR